MKSNPGKCDLPVSSREKTKMKIGDFKVKTSFVRNIGESNLTKG